MVYFSPVTTCIIALSLENLTIEARQYFFECSFWFLFYYLELFREAESNNQFSLKQRKSGEDKNVTFFTKNMCIQFLKTLFTNIQLIKIIPNLILDRDSTMPLEHKFGMVRLRCKYINTLIKFNVTLAQIQSYSFQKGENINGRKNSFGVNAGNEHGLYFDPEYDYKITDISPKDLVRETLNLAGFTKSENIKTNGIEWFTQVVKCLYPENTKLKKFVVSTTLEAGMHQGFRANHLIRSQNQFTNFSVDKINSPYEKFVSLFQKIFDSKPAKKDLINITEYVKDQISNTKIPNTKNKSEVFHCWFNENYLENEKMIKDFILRSAIDKT